MFIEDTYWVVTIEPTSTNPGLPFFGVLKCFEKETGKPVWRHRQARPSTSQEEAIASVNAEIDDFRTRGYKIPEIREA